MSREARVLRDENNELEKQLDDKTNDILTDIVVYIRSANISDIDQENVRRDITQMLIDARGRGENADDKRVFSYVNHNQCRKYQHCGAAQNISNADRSYIPSLSVYYLLSDREYHPNAYQQPQSR